MQHFVSVIFKNQLSKSKRDIVMDAVLNTAKVGLLESKSEYEIFESDNNTQVLRLALKKPVPTKSQQKFVETLANRLFDKGHDDFEIELSVINEEPFVLGPGLRVDGGRTTLAPDQPGSSVRAGSARAAPLQLGRRPEQQLSREEMERMLRSRLASLGVDVAKPSVAAKLARLLGRMASKGLGAASAFIPDPAGVGDYSQLQNGLDLSKPEDQIEYERRVAAFQNAQSRITDMSRDTPRLDNVSPRPTGQDTRSLRAQRAWDRKYGQTHNPDGTVNVRANEEITMEGPLSGAKVFMHGPIPTVGSSGKYMVMPKDANTNSDYNLLAMDLDLNNPEDAREFEERVKIWQEMQQDITNRPDQSRNETVDPRPVGAFLFRERAEWDKKYGSTHYKDGTKKPRRSFFESRDIEEVTYDGNEFFEAYGVMWYNEDEELDEAEYQGRKVKLGKPMRGDVKKFKVYVKNPKGNVVKVNFGDPDMKIKKSNPERRKSFRARHNCDNPGPRHKARYWSCRAW